MEENIIPKKNTPRDVFLHLLAMVTLYWSAITFVTLLWQFVDYFFPDNLNYFYPSISTDVIRFSISSLVIVFPVFILVSWYLNKIYAKEAQVRESKIRKWLIYLTLFITALFIIGDLISVINTFLSGGTTTSFILKALSILFVSAIIFGYYLEDVRRETPTKSARYFAWLSSILVLIVIVSAFFMVGTPNSARLIQYDQQKVSDLMGIQQQVVNYYQKKGTLPNSLSDLNDTISGYEVPTNPQTQADYEYMINSAADLDFELCTTFSAATPENQQNAFLAEGPDQNYWYHNAGHVCFSRIIDKQLYPAPANPAPVSASLPVK